MNDIDYLTIWIIYISFINVILSYFFSLLFLFLFSLCTWSSYKLTKHAIAEIISIVKSVEFLAIHPTLLHQIEAHNLRNQVPKTSHCETVGKRKNPLSYLKLQSSFSRKIWLKGSSLTFSSDSLSPFMRSFQLNHGQLSLYKKIKSDQNRSAKFYPLPIDLSQIEDTIFIIASPISFWHMNC